MKYINLFFLLSVLAPMAVRADGVSGIGDTVVPFQRIYDAVQEWPQLYDTDFVFLLGERVADKNYTLQKVAQACIDYAAYNNAVTKDICKEFVATAFGPSDVATESGGSVTDGVILTTTNDMPAETEITITINAAGHFEVDCNNDEPVQTIVNTEVEYKGIVCAYPTGGEHEIKITGHATDYPEQVDRQHGVIHFNTSPYLKSVQGSLGAIFPTLENGKQPNFAYAFNGCSALTEIPTGLFSGVNGAATRMFQGTFFGCSALTTIPDGLFDGVNDSADGMFRATFYGCSALREIHGDLFSGVTEAAEEMFWGTFDGCTSLTTIPRDLFSGVTGNADGMFRDTFNGCTNLEEIPEDLFKGVTGAAEEMFFSTFSDCTSLATIHGDLFSGVTGKADGMFRATFYGCSALTTIPDGLFSNVNGAAEEMFFGTFQNCSGLTTIPGGLFNGVNAAADDMFHGTFVSCSALTTIPEDLFDNVNDEAVEMFRGTFWGVPDVPAKVRQKMEDCNLPSDGE